MIMKRHTRSAGRVYLVTLAMLVFFACAVGTAAAFPTGQVVNMEYWGPPPNYQTEFINNSETVLMGPYQIKISSLPSDPTPSPSFVTYMMCFNASATVVRGTTYQAWATDTYHASVVFGTDKINMIAWLASKWGTDSVINANINKAMWEIMADYKPSTDFAHSGLDITGGSGFYLSSTNLYVGDITSLLTDAFVQRNTSIEANFLIPGWWGADGTWVYDTKVQPFVQPVPEPGTLLLLGSGLVGLGLHGWRKRSKAQR
jgi:hypothetical protein